MNRTLPQKFEPLHQRKLFTNARLLGCLPDSTVSLRFLMGVKRGTCHILGPLKEFKEQVVSTVPVVV